MQRRLRRFGALVSALPVALCTLLATPASAVSPAKIGGVSLDLPDAADGWVRGDNSGGVILTKSFPADAAKGRNKSVAVIQITNPVPAASAPFAANYAQM